MCPCWDVVHDTDVRAKELFGLFLVRVICRSHVDKDGAVLGHRSSGAGGVGFGACEKRGGLYSTSAIPGGILVMIWKRKGIKYKLGGGEEGREEKDAHQVEMDDILDVSASVAHTLQPISFFRTQITARLLGGVF